MWTDKESETKTEPPFFSSAKIIDTLRYGSYLTGGPIKKVKPFQVPTNDGKKIFEHFGQASSNFGDFSMAHMIAPPGWTEPSQTPDFDEFVIVVRGQLTLELSNNVVVVNAGESIVAPKGLRVRYANTSENDAEYVALCMPAFRPDRVHRDDTSVSA